MAWRSDAIGSLEASSHQLEVRKIPVWLTEAAVTPQDSKLYHLEVTMWNKPEYTEMRFGFEVTMYIANR